MRWVWYRGRQLTRKVRRKSQTALIKLLSSRSDCVHPQLCPLRKNIRGCIWRRKETSLKEFSQVTKEIKLQQPQTERGRNQDPELLHYLKCPVFRVIYDMQWNGSVTHTQKKKGDNRPAFQRAWILDKAKRCQSSHYKYVQKLEETRFKEAKGNMTSYQI